MSTLLQIGKVAERTGLSVRTIRWYEETGLVVPSLRTEGGFRLYSEDDVTRLLAVKRMKPLGLSLEEMADFLVLLERTAAPTTLDDAALAEAAARLDEYAGQTGERIRKLERDLANAHDLAQQLIERIGATATARAQSSKPTRG